jgi:cell wall-associated NlpC family hydrolase
MIPTDLYNAAALEIPPEVDADTEAITRLVLAAQSLLAQSAPITVDGRFGPKTRAALEAWAKRSAPVSLTPPIDERPKAWIARARASIVWAKKLGARYGLGKGGKNPKAEHPFELVAGVWRCDCSGLLAWIYGWTRSVPVPGKDDFWRNTDGLERDARGTVPGDLGFEVPFEQRRPGDAVVYGAGSAIGHCGILATMDTVIHCNGGSSPPPVDETRNLEWWASKGAIYLRVR